MNGAYVVIGLLYGKGDMDKTITISTRCGQDSDCNPSSAAGILAAALGRKRLPDKFTSAINPDGVFSHTAYTFPSLVAVCEKVAREAVIREGGFIEKDGDGKETLVIPVRPPRPGALMQSWEPGPPENCRYSQEELSEIVARE